MGKDNFLVIVSAEILRLNEEGSAPLSIRYSVYCFDIITKTDGFLLLMHKDLMFFYA